jgi:subfamily B ATP-binding cassette protein MsbA
MISRATGRLLKRVFRHSRLLAGVLAFTGVYALVSGVSLGMILPFVDLLFTGAAPVSGAAPIDPAGPFSELKASLQERASSFFSEGDPRDGLLRICGFLLGAFLLKGVLGFGLGVISVQLEERVLRDLRDDLFAHFQTLSMRWFSSRRAGDLLSRATNDVMLVRKTISASFRTLPRDLLLVVVYVAIVILASWRLAALCLVVLPLLALVVGALGRRIRHHSTLAQRAMADLASIFQETILGIRIVKAFGARDFAVDRFRKKSKGYLKSVVRLRRIASSAAPLAELIGALGAVIILWAGGNEVLAGGGLTPTWFLIFLAAMVSLMHPLRALTQLHTHFEEGAAAAARIFEVLDTEPSIRDLPGAKELDRFERAIEFENVSFEYDPDIPVIRRIDLRIAKGEVVALVGPSGAGKSTLVDILARFHDPDEGRVMLDGVDLREIRLASLRSLLSIVSQETILFHDTILANIAYADSEPVKERVIEAARAANAHEFVMATPKGYDTVIGDRGMRLSGGERQRLSIARAIYRDPEILILDEATASLDSESEAKVQEAIERLMEGRTAIVIAHRLSTVRNADRIVVLERGSVVEVGSHEELFARGGLYTRLAAAQFGTQAQAVVAPLP